MTDHRRLRLGTRASALARWQANWVAARLRDTGVEVEVVLITTEGDVKSAPLGQIGGQGLFTKQIQQALLDDEIDIAVHSLKDLPTENVAGLTIAAVPERESTGDALVSNNFGSIDELPQTAHIGTGSARRQAQLLHYRADLRVENIRGNVDTRLKKLDDGEYDAIILAEAGLRRLDLQDRITQILPRAIMLPAVGQGALGIETRAGDEGSRAALETLNDPETHSAVLAERAMLAALRGGCLAPVGAYARVEQNALRLDGVVLSTDGSQRIANSDSDSLEQATQLGQHVAQQLIDQGAEKLLTDARDQ